MTDEATIERNCDCSYCKNNHEFNVSDELMDDLLNGRVTLFAGAGISTESRNVLPETFYDSIAGELELENLSMDFPELMEAYCRQPNGRFKLLREIKDRLEHVDSFPELKRVASRFHRELATFFPIRTLITTNWDTYFEEYCETTPFVVDSDLAFWEAADRRVLKIHGSITNLGSLVATASDYKECTKRLNNGLIGGLLKTILATQTVIFIGYSLSDSDFITVYDFVKKQMASLHKQGYIVTPFAVEAERFEKLGLIPIITDGTYFIKQIKRHAVSKDLMLPDTIFEAAFDLLEKVETEHHLMHKTVKIANYPQAIFSAFYQDGMMHALGRALKMKGTGKYSYASGITGPIEAYLNLQKEKRRQRAYGDVAYIEGYVNALLYLLIDDEGRKAIPLYYAFGSKQDMHELTDFVKFLHENPNAHKASLKLAHNNLKKLSKPESIEFHHPPWL